MERQKIKIIYIGGYGRNGSTLLSLVLGQNPGFCPVGELHDVWESGFIRNELCSCGAPFKLCPFWAAVTERAFGELGEIDAREIQSMKRAVERMRWIPQLLFPRLRSAEYRRILDQYTDILFRLYSAIQKTSQSDIIVDSSKLPVYGFVLGSMGKLDLHLVHLVRDSRGMAYSLQKKRIRPEVYWSKAYMPVYRPLTSALVWNLKNILTQSMGLVASSYGRIRYEDLVANIQSSIARILAPAGGDLLEANLSGKVIKESHSHMIGGNPVRFARFPLEIRVDDEWRLAMEEKTRCLVTALTLPLLIYYGYSRELWVSRR